MVQGTTSDAGKSLLVAGLCRIYARRGFSVAPFKAQNMALNAAVTREGHEIGRAQALQARAAGIHAHVDMNPILLKPEGEARCQLVLEGRAVGSSSAREAFGALGDGAAEDLDRRKRVAVASGLDRLRQRHDLVILEGAGSPAEINLNSRDLVNMHAARLAEAPVVLVGDIDRGGVFAHFLGTLEWMDPQDRDRILGFVINKFRGDAGLLAPAPEMLEERTGKPLLGVLPWVRDLQVPDEDSVALERRSSIRRAGPDELEIAVVRFPRISNHDDLLALEHEAGVVVRFVENARELAGADLVVLPGSKSTRADLAWMRSQGIDRALLRHGARGGAILGICGGFQMLGHGIADPEGVEGEPGEETGLGLLPLNTRFGSTKTTRQVRVRPALGSPWQGELEGPEVEGYEIHAGSFEIAADAPPLFQSIDGSTSTHEGTYRGGIAGTSIHGVFENLELRRHWLAAWRRHAGLKLGAGDAQPSDIDSELDRWADLVESALDMDAIDAALGLDPRADGGSR